MTNFIKWFQNNQPAKVVISLWSILIGLWFLYDSYGGPATNGELAEILSGILLVTFGIWIPIVVSHQNSFDAIQSALLTKPPTISDEDKIQQLEAQLTQAAILLHKWNEYAVKQAIWDKTDNLYYDSKKFTDNIK